MKSKILQGRLFRYIFYILPGIVLYYLLPYLEAIESKTMLIITTRLCVVYIIGCILFAINALLLTFYDIYRTKDKQRSKPMKALIQIFQVILFFVGGIVIVSVLINKSPTVLFAGLGASAAVLMLIFKDTILGFVAGVQLSANDMLRIGDWIQLSDGSANGIVQEITLNTVKIQNWDNTISTVPPYTLVTTTFKNWRGMQESGGRRVDKTIKLDVNTLKFCSNEMIAHIRKEIPLMNDIGPMDNTMPTNIQLYRIYIERYLCSHPIVNKNLDLIISQKEPTQYGVPVEVYFFLSDKVWKEFEQIQSDIFDHLLVMVKEFDLKLYQLDIHVPTVLQ
ncbi:MAG: mechanosensitive ion channel family protein [Bacteroides sp]|nr:mechanosensitive ion channel family protein [Bacteroides sp.]